MHVLWHLVSVAEEKAPKETSAQWKPNPNRRAKIPVLGYRLSLLGAQAGDYDIAERPKMIGENRADGNRSSVARHHGLEAGAAVGFSMVEAEHSNQRYSDKFARVRLRYGSRRRYWSIPPRPGRQSLSIFLAAAPTRAGASEDRQRSIVFEQIGLEDIRVVVEDMAAGSLTAWVTIELDEAFMHISLRQYFFIHPPEPEPSLLEVALSWSIATPIRMWGYPWNVACRRR
ncbi:hypothetical protein C8J56DRAFT_1052073 [Mycena floridula]|nr:hypothetical protein C8J56DRAFT_1052073 [Mycena floridula]